MLHEKLQVSPKQRCQSQLSAAYGVAWWSGAYCGSAHVADWPRWLAKHSANDMVVPRLFIYCCSELFVAGAVQQHTTLALVLAL
jgi:hypothetical protein